MTISIVLQCSTYYYKLTNVIHDILVVAFWIFNVHLIADFYLHCLMLDNDVIRGKDSYAHYYYYPICNCEPCKCICFVMDT